MGMSEMNTWVLIRRYDKLEGDSGKLQTSLHQLTLTASMLPDELKVAIFRLLDVKDDGSRVIKIRQQDNSLVPISSLFGKSSEDEPFIIDVVGVHQYCPVQSRTILPGYIDAIHSSFYNLDKRVKLVEQSIPNVPSNQIQVFEETIDRLSDCMNFLDRRLDELAPKTWRDQTTAAT